MTSEIAFALQSEECLLLSNVLNEVINGFKVEDFDRAIGLKEPELQRVFTYLQNLRTGTEPRFSAIELAALRNALRETLRELGSEEFRTRTGFYCKEGQKLIDRIGSLIGEG